MKHLLLLFSWLLVATASMSQSLWKHGQLKVDKENQAFRFADGHPFFWMGDTGWSLLFQLNKEEIRKYLDKRQEQGFNVIQVNVFFREFDQMNNRYGQTPFLNHDFRQPNEKYFQLLDTVVKMAKLRNMFIAILPCWGDVVQPSEKKEAEILLDSLSAVVYGKWIGKRYKEQSNIIWVLAGDTDPLKNGINTIPIWRALAHSIKKASGNKFLMTYHPVGSRSSSQWMQQEDWLDFNMIQSSHGRLDAPTWDRIAKDLAMEPKKPSLDAEPNYEDHPVNPWPTWDPKSGYFRDHDVRKQLYRSVFAGAPGVTYGHHAVWQFLNERSEVINYADRGWWNAMNRPGANQVRFLVRLMQSRINIPRIRDTTLFADGSGADGEHMEACRAKDGSYAMIYLPKGKPVRINTNYTSAASLNTWWYNPKDGRITPGETLTRQAQLSFTPPSSGSDRDWVLVIDAAEKSLAKP